MRNPRLRSCSYLLCFAFAATLARAATVTTLPATAIIGGTATLNGLGNPGGSNHSGYFEHGTTTSYGFSTTQQPLGSGINNVNFSQFVSVLLPKIALRLRILLSPVWVVGIQSRTYVP